MAKLPVRQVTGEVFCHESEDYDKVVEAFALFFPKKSMKDESLPGVFGTTIRIIRAEVSKKAAQELVSKLVKELSSEDKQHILRELKLRVSEEGRLYLRFDKQVAYAGGALRLTSEEDDSIQVVIVLEAFPANLVGFLNASKSIFG